MGWYLCAAGEQLFQQVNRRWPKRDHASDGTIGDASHQASVSDHNPCWTCEGTSYGVVRAIDIDADLDKNDPHALYRLFDQLRARCKSGKELRVKYLIIYSPKHKRTVIASGTYPGSRWEWRAYTGSNPHIAHGHVSFTPRGDEGDRPFRLPILVNPVVRLKDELAKLTGRIQERLVPSFRDTRRKLRQARAEAKRIRTDIGEHKEER